MYCIYTCVFIILVGHGMQIIHLFKQCEVLMLGIAHKQYCAEECFNRHEVIANIMYCDFF